jgi:hypothetical protein
MTDSLRRRASFLLLGAFLLLPWAAAAEPHGPIDLGSLFTRLWNNLTSVWSQAGCSADPFGRCLPAPTTDAGCTIDPYGRCLPSRSTDEGCTIDPYGGCSS